uniref:Uncharacterized protein n=1 Tax=Anopheles atroparvus TaxID=41427 RepID=A0A182J3V6_ANOAO
MNATQSNVYLGEWYQKEADLNRQLMVSFFPSDNSVELVDMKTRKIFLRRTKIEELSENDFFIGAKLLIFGKQIDILDYGDAKTRNKKANEQLSFGMIKADALLHVGEILTQIHKTGLGVRRLAMLKVDENYSSMLKSVRSEASSLNYLMDCIPSQSFVALEIIGNNAYDQYRELCGPESISEAKQCAPNSFRGLYGNDVYCSRSADDAANESRFIFQNNDIKLVLRSSALFTNSTLCIIKPHVVREGKAGEIITEILRKKFTITAMKMLRFERANCEEFLEVYKGVVPEYESMVMQIISGDCVALEISNKYDESRSTYQSFRDFCGPICPEAAKITRPHTLRAMFGKNKVMNAVHCTDLEEDTSLELEERKKRIAARTRQLNIPVPIDLEVLIEDKIKQLKDNSFVFLSEVPFSKADKHEYFTVSRHGVTYWSDTENHFTDIDAWLADYRKYRRVTELGFFKHYRRAKAFRIWQRNIQWYKYESARQKIGASAFIALPRLAKALLTMQEEYVQLVGFRFFDVSVAENWHLPYFIETQMTTFEQVRDLLHQLRDKMRNVLFDACCNTLIDRGFSPQDEAINVTNKKKLKDMMSFTERANKRKLCALLARFLAGADQMMITLLHQILRESFKNLANVFSNFMGQQQPRKQPFMNVELVLKPTRIDLDPSREVTTRMLEDLSNLVMRTVYKIDRFQSDMFFDVYTEYGS